ncbi:MAG: 1-acyl-sn-glycerol-3-phosphate acyltransferase [Fibrobacter sp.]|nr:1-acyl-sn-glycerol-3-phosphate acyltransferase [Fibrobacter sp.]
MIFALAILPVAVLCKFSGNYRLPSSMLHYSLRFFVTKVLTVLGVISIEEIVGLKSITPLKPAIYVCNHRGKLDGPLILSYINYLKPTMKSKYARRPLFKILVSWFGFCEVDVQSNTGLLQTEQKCAEILKVQNVLFFPEGTRKTGDRLSDFKKMAFKIAINNKVPVIPVLLYNEVPFMTKKFSSFFPLMRVKFKIHFLEPVQTTDKTVYELTNEVYRLMDAELIKMSRPTKSKVMVST